MNFFSFGKIIDIQKTSQQKMINQYLLLKKHGKGSTSKVYLATDILSYQHYAIKVIKFGQKSKSVLINQIIHEIRFVTQINHKNIINFNEILFSEENKAIYIVMEYASYGSLDQILKTKGKISKSFASIIFKQVIKALVFFHQNRVVHRDIKPSNIVLTDKRQPKFQISVLVVHSKAQMIFSALPLIKHPK
jgi:serine/threonine protein kinase